MKKYLLGLLAIPFSLIAFSSAISISCVDGECTPSQIEVGPGICNNGMTNLVFNGSVECEDQEENVCFISFYNADNNFFGVDFRDGEIDLEESACNFEGDSNKTFTIDASTVINLNGLTLNGGGNNGGGNNGGGNEGGNTGGGVISDGFGSFTPVITGVKDTIFQLIPLVIYIGIGVLISILGFYAIRWLVNWIGGKINSYFNSKRD